MKRTKYIPAIVTLTGCLAAAIISLVNHFNALKSMVLILAVLVGFYIAGLIIKALADKYLVIEEEIPETEELEANETDETDEEKLQEGDAETEVN